MLWAGFWACHFKIGFIFLILWFAEKLPCLPDLYHTLLFLTSIPVWERNIPEFEADLPSLCARVWRDFHNSKQKGCINYHYGRQRSLPLTAKAHNSSVGRRSSKAPQKKAAPWSRLGPWYELCLTENIADRFTYLAEFGGFFRQL